MLRKRINLVLLLMLSGILLFGCGTRDNKEEASVSQTNEETGPASSTGLQVAIDIEEYGVITVQLDSENAPITVDNFIGLVREGFYDGLTFHRIISGFMIQGGDPLGTGMGGSEETIKGEFASNGVDNKISHARGVISMARSREADSASSQFFIVHQDSPHLDGDYAAFGQVIEGIEIVDEICEEISVQDGNGSVAAADQPKIKSIEIID